MPFYNFTSGLSLQMNGVPVAEVSTLNFQNGEIDVAGAVANYLAPATSITDGANTVSPLALLTVNNLSLGVDVISPTPKQIKSGNNSSAQLDAAPAVGNYVLFLVTRALQDGITAGFPLLTESSNWSGGYAGYQAAAYGGFFEGGANPEFNGHAQNWCLIEVENVAGVDSVLSGSDSDAGPIFTTSGDSFTFSGHLIGAVKSTAFWIAGEAEQNGYAATDYLPAGSTLMATMTEDAYSYACYSPGLISETPTMGLTLTGAAAPGGFAMVNLKGVSGANASITAP